MLRHLPYLDQELYREHWTLADNTLHINYARGQLYADYLERDTAILPLPGHIIWLTEGLSVRAFICFSLPRRGRSLNIRFWGESIEIDL